MSLVDADVFDPNKIEELRLVVRGNEEFLKRIRDVYLTQFENKFPELREAITRGDERVVCSLAHLLKGASYTVALYRVAASFGSIEERAKDIEMGEDFTAELSLISQHIDYFTNHWIHLFTGETSKVDLS